MNYVDKNQIKKIKTWLGAGSINIFGIPFAGKDTQGKRLAELFGGVLLGGGDILRGSVIPEHIQEDVAAGRLIPTDDYLQIVLPYLSQEDFKGKPLILSSVGRWHGEEAGVLEATAAADHPLRIVIYLHVKEGEERKRWQISQSTQDRGTRVDDSEDILLTRLEEFKTKTIPVINFYRDEGMVIEINGNQSPEQVTADIISALNERIREQEALQSD
jgi:adenylate kinase